MDNFWLETLITEHDIECRAAFETYRKGFMAHYQEGTFPPDNEFFYFILWVNHQNRTFELLEQIMLEEV